MDSINDRDDKMSRQNGHEWETDAFSWDNMKDGIFEKILEEYPQFFEEKRRRRILIWFWFGAAVLLLGGGGFFLLNEQGKSVKSSAPFTKPNLEKTGKSAASAVANQPATSIEKSELEEKNKIPHVLTTVPTDVNSPVSPSVKTKANRIVSIDDSANLFTQKASPTPALFDTVTIAEPNTIGPVSQSEKIDLTVPSVVAMVWKPLVNPIAFPQLETTLVSLPDDPIAEQQESQKGKWRFAATGGILASFSGYSGSSAAATLRNDHTSPYPGYHLGLDAWAPLGKKSYLQLGLDRQVASQNIDIYTERPVDILQKNVLVHLVHYVVGGRTEGTYGDTLVTAIQKNRLVHYNSFKSVQLQAGYVRVFERQHWVFSPFAGLAGGLLTSAEGVTVAVDKSIFAYNNAAPIFERFQFKTLAGMELERKLNGQISLLLRYRFEKQWNNASTEVGLELRPSYHLLSIGIAKRW
ncbi:MAG: hypothetical protein GC192_22480 [Bacteroidetes bacterium]|nr:hypothetical protein [Bacteroidota bacterium]